MSLDAKAELIDQVASTARARLEGGRADEAERFVRRYYAGVAPEDLLERHVLDLYGAAVSHWTLGAGRAAGATRVRVSTPRFDQDGWQSTHTVVEIVTDDMPFLVDSTRMELNRQGEAVHLIVHPVVDGAAYLHLEIDRQSDPEVLAEVEQDVRRVLDDVRAAVEDWPAMQEAARRVAAWLGEPRPGIDPDEAAEAAALLGWMVDGSFTFLGSREYDLEVVGGDDVLRAVAGTGLGILRQAEGEAPSKSLAKLPAEIRRLARTPVLLNLTKANARSTVHRPANLDYVGVKRFDDDGQPCGEWRFLGLFTSEVYRSSATTIPVVRRKVARVRRAAGFDPAGHDGKDLLTILEDLPRDELLQIDEDDLLDTALGILRLGERQRVRLFVRRERFGRYHSCLLFMPRAQLDTGSRLAVQRLLVEGLHGTAIEHLSTVTESALARLHFSVAIDPSTSADVDVAALERRIAATVQGWTDELRDVLVEAHGEERGVALHRRYRNAFPPAYRHDHVPRTAAADIARLEAIGPGQDLATHLYRPLEAPEGLLRFKVHRLGAPLLLSDVLPVLERMGAKVLDERPSQIEPEGGPQSWLYDFGLSCVVTPDARPERLHQVFEEAFDAVWRGAAESDGFNRLVVLATLGGATWWCCGPTPGTCARSAPRSSQAYMEDTLAAHPPIARLLVDLFHARFDPAAGGAATRAEGAAALVERITAAIDDVTSLDESNTRRVQAGSHHLLLCEPVWFRSSRLK